MAEAALLAQKDGHVLTVTINRPEKKNAVNAEVLCGLSDAWTAWTRTTSFASRSSPAQAASSVRAWTFR
jgi:enoyl-CoA hydratase/carnithine racemase